MTHIIAMIIINRSQGRHANDRRTQGYFNNLHTYTTYIFDQDQVLYFITKNKLT